MNSISYLDSVFSRSLSSSRKGSGTTTPTGSSSGAGTGGGSPRRGGQRPASSTVGAERAKLNRRASDNILTDRAAATRRNQSAALAFTPFRASIAASGPLADASGSSNRQQDGITAKRRSRSRRSSQSQSDWMGLSHSISSASTSDADWPEGDPREDEELLESDEHEGEDADAGRGFLRNGKGMRSANDAAEQADLAPGTVRRRAATRSRSDFDGTAPAVAVQSMRRTGSSPGPSSEWEHQQQRRRRRQSGTASGSSSRATPSRNSWANLWGLTGWSAEPTPKKPSYRRSASTASGISGSEGRRRSRRAQQSADGNLTAEGSQAGAAGSTRSSSRRASVHTIDVELMSEMERENIVEFAGGDEEEEDEEDHLHMPYYGPRMEGGQMAEEEASDPRMVPLPPADKAETDLVSDESADDRSEQSRNRSESMPMALATDLATSEAKAQVEKEAEASLLRRQSEAARENGTAAAKRAEAEGDGLILRRDAPPSYDSAVHLPLSVRGTDAAQEQRSEAGQERRQSRLARGLRRMLKALQRAILYLLAVPLRALGLRIVPASQLHPRVSVEVTSAAAKDESLEKAQEEAPLQARILPPRKASRLLPNPHPVENLLGHDPKAKKQMRSMNDQQQAEMAAAVAASALSRSKRGPSANASASIIHHSPKTLVLDLDETLIHSTSRSPNWAVIRHAAGNGPPGYGAGAGWTTGGGGLLGMEGGIGDMLGLRAGSGSRIRPHMVEVVLDGRSVLYHVYKRPWVDLFLRKVAAWYNVVIFTASVQEYADPVIDWLDQGRGLIAGRYFRDTCTFRNGSYLKDLAMVDPDLSRVCLVDNSPASYHLNPANGIPIEGWTHDPRDEALLDLLPVLDSLRFATDVRHILGVRLLDASSA